MCSRRSWPTQNARPVPVSTTHRTVASWATAVSVSTSASFVAMSSEFMASGRFRRTVATEPSRSTRTGGCVVSVMRAILPDRRRTRISPVSGFTG